MHIVIPVYSEQALTPRASEVIRGIVDNAYPEHTIKFQHYALLPIGKTLVFGSKGPSGNRMWREFVHTYSIAQIMAKPNAATVLASAVRQFVQEPEKVPFEAPIYMYSAHSISETLDPDKPTAIDIETDGNLGKMHTPEEVNVISIAFYQEGHPPIVLVAGSHEGRMFPLARTSENTRKLLSSFKYGIYHNGKFDTRVMNRYFGVQLCVWFDTMLAHHTLNIAAGEHGLKPLAQRYLNAPEWEGDLKKYTRGGGHYELIPLPKLVEYNGWDVYWTYKLFELFGPQIEADEEAEKAFMFEMRAAKFLLEVEKYGIPFDNGYADDYDVKLTKEIEKLIACMRVSLSDENYNPNSPQQVVRALHSLGISVTGTDAKKILKPYLEENEDSMGPVAKAFLEWHLQFKELDKRRGTYARGWAKASRKGRVHPTFLVHGTSTGRLSSTSPNAQNVPRDKTVRKLVRTHG